VKRAIASPGLGCRNEALFLFLRQKPEILKKVAFSESKKFLLRVEVM
jgi:hypothetical protein